MSKRYNRPLHTTYERKITDKRIRLPRISAATSNAIDSADAVVIKLGAKRVDRVCLVFTDDKRMPERLACVVFALGDQTLVADVNARGAFVNMTRYNVKTTKRIPRDFMYEIAGECYDNQTHDNKYENYNTKVFARNRSCYK